MSKRTNTSTGALLTATLVLAVASHASEVSMPGLGGHLEARFPLSLHVSTNGDDEAETALHRAVDDWNRIARNALGVEVFRTADTEQADVRVELTGAGSESRLMGQTELDADQGGVIVLPVRVTVFDALPRGETSRATLLYQIAAHELGHALGLPHVTAPESVMCCVREEVDFEDPSFRDRYVAARRHPDLSTVEPQLAAHYARFWAKANAG